MGPLLRQWGRQATIGLVGGIAAGVLVGGFGSRLVMRILAATSGDEAKGLLTDADEAVVEVTIGGTLGLVLFVGVVGGALGGLLYAGVGRWLPSSVWLAGIVFGTLLLVVFARLDPLSPENRDFTILHPTWRAVLLVAALLPLFGMTVAAFVERLDQSWPRHPATFAPLVLLLLSPAVALVVIPAVCVALLLRTQGLAPR